MHHWVPHNHTTAKNRANMTGYFVFLLDGLMWLVLSFKKNTVNSLILLCIHVVAVKKIDRLWPHKVGQ
jgi:hypothetical protein